MTNNRFTSLLTLTGTIVWFGCGPSQDQAPSKEAKATTTPQTPQTAKLTFSDLPISPKPEVTPEFLARGKKLYNDNCAACHGVNGDAKSDAAAFLLPKPRSFVDAKYRLRSTPSGSLPTDTDLFRSISLGMPGTPMPPWRHMLSDDDRWALVEYVKSFSPRFQDKEEQRIVVNVGSPAPRSQATIAEGKVLYAQMQCAACHGETGQGNGASAAMLTDDSGTKSKPRDFTKPGTFKSGYATKEIVRSILTGFEGTPMVGFNGAISTEDAWKIAYYLETLAKPAPTLVAQPSQNFLERETLGEPDVRIKLTERNWKYDPDLIRVKKGQVVEITFEPTDNGLGVGHGFAISSYDEVAFINGVMVGGPKSVKFRADRAGKFTYYCSTQCSTDKLHPLMNGTFIVEDTKATASLK